VSGRELDFLRRYEPEQVRGSAAVRTLSVLETLPCRSPRPYPLRVSRRRPSLVHQVLTHVIPRIRDSSEVVDAEEVRRAVLARQARRGAVRPPRSGGRLLRGCSVGALDGHPFPVFDLRPPGPVGDPPGRPARTVLYLHGGALVGDVDVFHWRLTSGLARASGARVVLPAYPLAPTHTWRDSHPALLRLFEQVAIESPQGVTLMGDSAGGGLALAVAQQAAALPGPQPTGLALVSPWVDLAGDTPGTEEQRAHDPWLRLTKLRLYGGWWAGDDDVHRPEVSPLHGDMRRLPPTVVQCGTRDLLLPQVRALAGRLRTAGVETTYREEPGLLHAYPVLPVPEAGPARRELAAFVGR
jgi:monoterpene epsilon-lactone hydrolase